MVDTLQNFVAFSEYMTFTYVDFLPIKDTECLKVAGGFELTSQT